MSFRHRKPVRHAFTLIEVVAGITLMAILLTAILVSYGRHATQIRKSHDRITATRELDMLIGHWMRRPSLYEGRFVGAFRNQPDLRWRRLIYKSPVAQALNANVVRWEVYRLVGELPERVAKVDMLVSTEGSQQRSNTEQSSVARTR